MSNPASIQRTAVRWVNAKGRYHRADGPAVEDHSTGYYEWYTHGRPIRREQR